MFALFINRSKTEEVFIRKCEEGIQLGPATVCVRKLASKITSAWEPVAWFPAISREMTAALGLPKVCL